MKKICLLFSVLLCAIFTGGVYAYDDVYSGVITADTDLVIGGDSFFYPDSLNILNSISILNGGAFKADVCLCDGCDLYLRNQGEFTAYISSGNSVYQVIADARDLNAVSINRDYSLLVSGANHLLLNDIYDVSGSADKIIIRDSVIDLGALDGGRNYALELMGNVVLYLDGVKDSYDGALIHNVSGNADITLVVGTTDPLFANVAYIDDGDLYVRRVRELDYVKVLGAGVGDYLNDIRILDSGDRLIGALDSVTDMHALYEVMGMSARLNPDKLLESVRIIGAMDDFSMFFQSGGGVQASVITSNDFDAYDFSGVIGLKIGDVKFGVGARFGELYYLSDVDEFDGLYYGINLYADYVLHGDMFVRGLVAVNNFEFDIGDVFYRNQRINNPNVLLGNMLVDYGVKYRVWDHINVTPFVGVDMNFYKLGNICDFDFGMRTGIGVGYAYQMHAINYDYKMNVVLNTLGEMGVRLGAGFWSIYDNAGGDIGVSMMRIMDTMAYELTIDAKISF